MSDITIYTVGHSTHPIDEFIDLLETYGIRKLIDVRTIAKSRHNPQFGEAALAASVRARKITYRRMTALGGLRHVRKDSINGAWRNASFQGYADYMQTEEFADAIDLLVERGHNSDAAIMCAEAVPWRCHRSMIGDALVVRGVVVLDIMTKKSAPPHTLTSFARVDGSRVSYPASSETSPWAHWAQWVKWAEEFPQTRKPNYPTAWSIVSDRALDPAKSLRDHEHAVIRYHSDRWYRRFVVDSRREVEEVLQSIAEYRYVYRTDAFVLTFWSYLTTCGLVQPCQQCGRRRVHNEWMPRSSPISAWKSLREGNERFINDASIHPSQGIVDRAKLVNEQHPTAVLFGCGDSRVAAEIIFDQGLGDMFVVRTAGHVLDDSVLGSIEYAIDVLDVPLIVVLGHDSCGAVKATLDALDKNAVPDGFIRSVIERVTPSILMGRREGLSTVDELEGHHVVETGSLIMQRSRIIAEKVDKGACAIVGVTYTLSDGHMRLRGTVGDIGETVPNTGGLDAPLPADWGTCQPAYRRGFEPSTRITVISRYADDLERIR